MAKLRVVMDIPMKLHNHLAVENELLVVCATMPTLETENRLIPEAASFNVADCYEWLRVYGLLRDNKCACRDAQQLVCRIITAYWGTRQK